jgi:hypothetical protein
MDGKGKDAGWNNLGRAVRLKKQKKKSENRNLSVRD